jgi:molybdate transport system substrate-binding protein
VSNSRMKKLALSLSAAITAMYSPAHAQSIRVAVAPSFSSTANDIVAAFGNYYYTNYSLSYGVTLIIKGASEIEADIIAGGNTGPYDLFLSSSIVEPYYLQNNYPTLVSGSSFNYARDVLELYSPSVDVTGGLPYPLTTNFVIPSPTNDTYGAAAAQILASPPWNIPSSSIPGGYVFTEPTVGTTYSVIKKGLYPYGFVAKSQICRYVDGGYIYPANSYYLEYKPNDRAHPYTPLHLNGIALALTARTTAAETELANFISFLTGTADSYGVTNTIGTSIIQSYCFRLP